MMMKTIKVFGLKRSGCTSIIAVFLSLLALTQSAPADLVNGDFAADISDPWFTVGPVEWYEDFQAAIFFPEKRTDKPPEEMAEHSTLSQLITIDPGFTRISFDLIMDTSGNPNTDVFTASLNGEIFYELSSDDVIAKDLERYEETVAYDAETLLGPIDTPVVEVTLQFNLAHDNHPDDPETVVLLDNVALTPVPGAFLLGAIGLGVAKWRLRRHRTV